MDLSIFASGSAILNSIELITILGCQIVCSTVSLKSLRSSKTTSTLEELKSPIVIPSAGSAARFARVK